MKNSKDILDCFGNDECRSEIKFSISPKNPEAWQFYFGIRFYVLEKKKKTSTIAAVIKAPDYGFSLLSFVLLLMNRFVTELSLTWI